jgi:hypothetical protein
MNTPNRPSELHLEKVKSMSQSFRLRELERENQELRTELENLKVKNRELQAALNQFMFIPDLEEKP